MTRVIDRYILRSLVMNYVIALAVMMSLYVVLDLFFNLDEFTERGSGTLEVVRSIATYYGVNLSRYFAQLSGVITLFACTLTLARLRKQNELTAVLASGISLYRVAAPVFVFGMFTTALWYVDTEWVIPQVADRLARKHDEARGDYSFGVWFLNDEDNRLVSARSFTPNDQTMQHFLVLERDRQGRLTSVIEAERAVWEASATEPAEGYWKLEAGRRRSRVLSPSSAASAATTLEEHCPRYETGLSPSDVEARQGGQWVRYLSSRQLAELVDNEHLDQRVLEQVMNARFTTPLVNILLLLLGIPVILNRMPGSVLNDGARCLLITGACFLTAFVGQNVIRVESLSALPSWLPIILFAPVAAVLFDRMKT